MAQEKISQELRLRNIEETRIYLNKEVDQNELINNKHKIVCTTLKYIENFLTIASPVTRCISISAFASLLGIPIGITSSEIVLKVCAIAAGIKTYESIIKKKRTSTIKEYC